MPLKIPFTRANFATEMKPKLSGANVTLSYDNLESPMTKAGADIADLIGQSLYDKLCDGTAAKTEAVAAIPADGDIPEVPAVEASEEVELNALAKDYLQFAVINFAIYEHTIFLISHIGNDGITQKKNDYEAPLYKYQKENLDNKLINDAWYWMNRLIKLLNDNAAKFADWKDSDQRKELNEIPVKVADFKKWIGVSDEYFMLNAAGLIREVWTECVASRNQKEKTPEIARAVCYEVIARACTVLSYYCLPEPIRRDINNELSKDHASQADTYIREKVSARFQAKADAYWRVLDTDISNKATEANSGRASTQVYKSRGVCESDSFGY